MKLKRKLTQPQPPFRPAENRKAAKQRRNGRRATKNPLVRQKFGGR